MTLPALHLHERGTAKLTGVAGASVVVGTLRLKSSFAVAITTVYGLSDLNAAGAKIEIETLGASDDEDGAYRLPIPAGRISFWTELPPPSAGGDDDERKRSGTRKGQSKAAKRKPAARGA